MRAAGARSVVHVGGGWVGIAPAVLAGADAVYFGLQQFNARARASNFDESSLSDTVHALHKRGVVLISTGGSRAALEKAGAFVMTTPLARTADARTLRGHRLGAAG